MDNRRILQASVFQVFSVLKCVAGIPLWVIMAKRGLLSVECHVCEMAGSQSERA